MNTKEKTLLTVTVLGTLIFGATTVGLLTYHQSSKSEPQTYKSQYLAEVKKYEKAQKALDEEITTSSSSAQESNSMGGLQDAVNTVFTAYYTFDTRKSDEYIKRDEVAKKYMTQAIDDQLFPASSKIRVTDSQFVSLLHGNPVVYIKTDSSSVVTAIVDCNFSVEAFGAVTATNDYYFQITYDTSLKQITGVTELGKLQKSTN